MSIIHVFSRIFSFFSCFWLVGTYYESTSCWPLFVLIFINVAYMFIIHVSLGKSVVCGVFGLLKYTIKKHHVGDLVIYLHFNSLNVHHSCIFLGNSIKKSLVKSRV